MSNEDNQFAAAKQATLGKVHKDILDAVFIEHQKIVQVNDPGFAMVHVAGRGVVLNDPHLRDAIDELGDTIKP